jgi:hypothetical protein
MRVRPDGKRNDMPPNSARSIGCNRYSAATIRRRYYLGLEALEVPSRPAPVASIDNSVPNAATHCCHRSSERHDHDRTRVPISSTGR